VSKKAWRRCPVSGISLAKLQFSDALRDDGAGLETALYPDCNVFAEREIAEAAGFGRVDHWKARALCGSFFHLRPITAIDADGRVYRVGWATHTQSARWGGEKYREAARARQLAGRPGGRPRASDVSAGSGCLADQLVEIVVSFDGGPQSQMLRVSGAK
jgi:hypothetical protein